MRSLTREANTATTSEANRLNRPVPAMAPAASIAVEYGMSALGGTGYATKRIKTGGRVRGDGDAGTVTILED